MQPFSQHYPCHSQPFPHVVAAKVYALWNTSKWNVAPASHVVFNDQSPRRIVCQFFQSIYTHVFMYILYIDISTCIYVHHIFFRCKSPHFSIFPASQGDAMGCGASAHRYQADGSEEVQARSREDEDLFNPVMKLHILGSNKANLRSFWVICPLKKVYWCVLFWWVVEWPL